jgi:hypothetical protein
LGPGTQFSTLLKLVYSIYSEKTALDKFLAAKNTIYFWRLGTGPGILKIPLGPGTQFTQFSLLNLVYSIYSEKTALDKFLAAQKYRQKYHLVQVLNLLNLVYSIYSLRKFLTAKNTGWVSGSRPNFAAYVCIRQHTYADVCRPTGIFCGRQHTSAYVSIRKKWVGIRQHTYADVCRPTVVAGRFSRHFSLMLMTLTYADVC